ncbi:hypothetical protein NEH60_20540, partial [Xanthomonas hortorum pv. pelargonii]|uniref:hypothetical protein n=1 Tax=Xanthomonas hortorum TaxID=56454 RepID=UPI0020444791
VDEYANIHLHKTRQGERTHTHWQPDHMLQKDPLRDLFEGAKAPPLIAETGRKSGLFLILRLINCALAGQSAVFSNYFHLPAT